jgi:hypothetical protein
MTHEFEDFVLSDWLENKKWFDIKLLVDPSGGSFEKAYVKLFICQGDQDSILIALGIVALHLVHLGRNLAQKS